MNLLLDTHIAIWAVEDNPRLSARAGSLISNPAVDVHVSVVSLWEIAIKHALGRGGGQAMPMSAAEALGYFTASGYTLVLIKAAHVLAVETLEPHHSDPFDRLLVGTALCEPFCLVTHDQQLAAYSDTVMVV